MALLTGLFGGTPDALCAAMQDTSPLSGMVPMYLLMSTFHAAPWVRLVRGQSPSPSPPSGRDAPRTV
jgi:hypothetical protein